MSYRTDLTVTKFHIERPLANTLKLILQFLKPLQWLQISIGLDDNRIFFLVAYIKN